MKRKLKLLHVGNGKAFKIKAIVDAMLKRGHEVHMIPIPPSPQGWDGVVWHQLEDPPVPGKLRVPGRMLQVRRLARQLRPDVVHAHNAWGPGWYGAMPGLHPFVIHAYGGDVLPEQYKGRSRLQRNLTSWACRTADRVIVTGKHMIEAAGALGIPRERLVLLSRGVDLESYRPGRDTDDLRKSLGISGASPVILSPRYQVDEALYNLDVVIEAFATLKAQFPGAVCVQLFDPGRDQGRSKLHELAARRELGESYRLVPMAGSDRMPLFYNMADVVVSVPSSDGFPVTVLEASACGAALIVSELPYCKEWFVDGENGLIVPPRDAKALAGAMGALCGSVSLRQQFGGAGRKLVQERADYQQSMDTLESIYYHLLEARSPMQRERT